MTFNPCLPGFVANWRSNSSAILALALLTALSSLACAGQRPVTTSLSAEEWRQDLDYLARQLPRRHVRPYGRVSRQDFQRAVDDLRRRVSQLSAEQVVIELGRIVALIGDGHTELIPFQRGTGFHRLPLVFHFFGNETRIIAVAPGHEVLLGQRVDAIGGRPVDAVMEALGHIVARDNDSELLHSGPEYLATPEVLVSLGLASPSRPIEISVESQDGRPALHAVPSLTREAVGSVRWITARDHLGVEGPLMSRNPAKDYWFEYREDDHLLFVKYNRCQDQNGEPTIRRFARDLFAFADTHPVERLVLDLRHNAGGDNKKNSPLIEGIARRKSLNSRGRLYVLVGRMTFSAAMDAANRLSRETEAIFVGEPPRGRPNTLGDVETLVLPHSGLRVDYATKEYKRMPQLGDAAYFPIDLLVEPSWADYISGRDPAVEAILHRGRGEDQD